jgi:imidazole glycerol-phosphate synthase subunit HisH
MIGRCPEAGTMTTIVNYGIGNLDSVLRAFRNCSDAASISNDPAEIAAAERIVLPGVGSFAKAMEYLRQSGLLPVLEKKVLEEKTPVLGICLGFQMFTRHSEEGDAEGLGWIDGYTRKFDFTGIEGPRLKIPHMGWNDLQAAKESPLLAGIHPDACFYFAHSYYVSCDDNAAVLARSAYGLDFVSAVHRGNIFGTQFHPEKSHANGLQLIRNFLEYRHE